MSDEDDDSAVDLAASASGLPLVGADPDDIAFAQVKLPGVEILAVFRPDFEEGERMAWYHVGCCLRTPCLWPLLIPLYPWLVGCARYSTKVVHETFYVATDRGVVTVVNEFETRLDECCSPRVRNELRKWEDIEEIIERRGGDNSVLGDSGVFFKLTEEAQKATNTVGDIWYVPDPASCVKVLQRLHRRHMAMQVAPSPVESPRRRKTSNDDSWCEYLSPVEKRIFVSRATDPDAKRAIMVHEDMSCKAFRSLVLYALDLDLPPSAKIDLTLQASGAPVLASSSIEEDDVILVSITM